MLDLTQLLQNKETEQFNSLVRKNKNFAVFGLNIGEKIALTQSIARPICLVVENEQSAQKYSEAFKLLGKHVVTISREVVDYTYHLMEFGSDTKDRQVALFDMLFSNVDLLILTPNVLAEPVVPKQIFVDNVLTLRKDADIAPDDLVQKLTAIGYLRTNSVEQMGQFAKRGDVVDIFPLNFSVPVRVYFFDTQIEKITTFNILSQYAIEPLQELKICPNGYILDTGLTKDLQTSLTQAVKLASKSAEKHKKPNEFLANLNSFAPLKESLNISMSLSMFKFLSVFMHVDNILSYLNNPLVIFDQPKICFEQLSNYLDNLSTNINDGIECGLLLGAHKNLQLQPNDVIQNLSSYQKISFQSILTQNKFFAPDEVLSISTNPLPNFNGNFKEPAHEIARLVNIGDKVLFCAKDNNDAVSMQQGLTKSTNLQAKIITDLSKTAKNGINIAVLPIKYGFSFSTMHLYVFGFNEIQTRHNIKKTVSKNKNAFSSQLTLPKVGEYVVHDVHGIGICEGVKQLTVNNATRDYLVITYKNNDKLYVPTEQIDMLSRYVGSDKNPTLNVLGGTQFEKIKQKVRNSVKQLAINLIQLYKERQQLKGFKYEITDEMREDIDQSFAYTLTADQQHAVEDVYADLSLGKIMDRLVVGDVGYGKTEVAIRTAYVTALNGKQVAIMAPTTILCEQHYNTFVARLDNFGIKVACIDRFKTKKEQKQILSDLKNGKINIICGTHRLLSKDVEFFDLGLLVLDEEQKFGVGDKEKIKNMKKSVNVLTLSATPIPRTLHMSLVGIRDISVIETPPVDRLPVQTVVSQFSNTLLTTAINRELDRGGQVLVVAPKIVGLDDLQKRINELTGNKLRVAQAHGQMDKEKLESTMLQLYRGNIDVLIATSLIENGIDLPNANTLFVVNSEDFGLSQLYQLRGRVGRSDKLAWAYFTYMDETKITSTTYARLTTLLEYSQLGSGFKIAMRDLEIRGAGDVFGANQHGQMAQVGYDMYCKLLESEISELQGKTIDALRPSRVDVDVDAFIPQSFSEDTDERMELYSMIAGISTLDDYNRVLTGISDRWGNVPEPVLGLCKVSLVKTLAEKYGIERVSLTHKKAILYIALDYRDFADQMTTKISTHADWRVYKKDNWAIFERVSQKGNWEENFDSVIKILN